MTPLFVISPLLAAQQVVLRTISGNTHEGTLTKCTPSEVQIEQSDQAITIPTHDLLSLKMNSDESRVKVNQTFVGLTDGSQLPVEIVAVLNRKAKIKSPLQLVSEQVLASQISWIELRPLGSEARNYLQNVLNEDSTDDSLIVQKGDPPQFDHLSGVLGDITPDAVNFNWDGEDIFVKRSKLAAVTYFHPQEDSIPTANCVVTSRSGAKLMASSMSYDGSNNLSVTLLCGLRVQLPISEFVAADFSAGKIVYLSSLEPLQQRWTPLVGIPDSAELIQQYGLPRRDQSYAGSSLTLAWPTKEGSTTSEIRPYEKGLALRSRTTVAYRIPKGTVAFRAFAGIDPQSADQGNVRLEISADKSKLWEGEIDGSRQPEEISLDLSRARRLQITVDYGKNLDYGDRLHLAEARLIKE